MANNINVSSDGTENKGLFTFCLTRGWRYVNTKLCKSLRCSTIFPIVCVASRRVVMNGLIIFLFKEETTKFYSQTADYLTIPLWSLIWTSILNWKRPLLGSWIGRVGKQTWCGSNQTQQGPIIINKPCRSIIKHQRYLYNPTREGFLPRDTARHHRNWVVRIIKQALATAKLQEKI